MMLGGMAAPAFLFMAGVAVALARRHTMRRGALAGRGGAAWSSAAGWQIFLYAFLFRLQSFVLGGFANAAGLLKVDILNIMGPAIVATACVVAPSRQPADAGACAGGRRRRSSRVSRPPFATPRGSAALAGPARVVSSGPIPGRAPSPCSPGPASCWPAAVLGLALDGGRGWAPWRLQAARRAGRPRCWSGRPSGPPGSRRCFPTARFWTSSPAFFALRVGLLVLCVHVAWLWSVRPWPRLSRRSPLEVLGVGSLFVYWVHVELVYGGATGPLRPAA